MGYEVDVKGMLTFFDSLEKMYKEFKKDEYEPNTIGYFFTDLIDWETLDNYTHIFYKEGKLWYDCDEVMNFLAKFANGTVYFYGEDNEDWKYVLEDGKVERFEREAEW